MAMGHGDTALPQGDSGLAPWGSGSAPKHGAPPPQHCHPQGTVLCDIILLNFLKGAEHYKARKFEEVRHGAGVPWRWGHLHP